jgi:muramoyltetrapeptide carboxypeptidase
MLAKKLKKWDTIGLVAPSKPLKEETKTELSNFIRYIEAIWCKVKLSKNFHEKDIYWVSAWTPKMRAEDINDMFSDNAVNAIWCLQGWDTANQVLPYLDYKLIQAHPKIFIWKSDIDLLHLALYKKTWLICFHSCDTKIWANKELDFDYNKERLEKRLFQTSKEIVSSNTEDRLCLKKGKANWKVLGCNIGCMLKLAWTEYLPDFTGAILFIETYVSNPWTILYRLTQLEQMWIFQKAHWVIIGSNYKFQSEDFEAYEIIRDFLTDYNFPILKINEFGHYQPHMFLPIWTQVELDATNKKIHIIEDFLV